MTAEEVRSAPDVVAGMYLLTYAILRFVYVYIVLYIGTFLVSYVPSLVLFDSGASRSFVSLSFSHHISARREALSRPLRVSIANDHAVFATDVFWGWVLENFSVEFLIDLVPIVMGDVCVIVGMDWLRRFGAMIDWEH